MGLGTIGAILIVATYLAAGIATIPFIGPSIPLIGFLGQNSFLMYFLGGALIGWSYTRNMLYGGLVAVAVLVVLHIMGITTIPLLPR